MILNVEYTDVVRADANEFENTYFSLGGSGLAPANICITKGSCCCSCSKQ